MMKNKIVFATIPIDYAMQQPEELEAHWEQFVQLLRIESFPVQRLIFFVNSVNKKHIPFFYRYLQKHHSQARIKFVNVVAPLGFSARNLRPNYGFFCDWFSAFSFDTEHCDYYFYFARGNLFAHAFMLTMLINVHHLPCQLVHLRRNLRAPSPPWLAEVYDAQLGAWIAEISDYEREAYHSQSLLKSSIPTSNEAFNQLISQVEHVALHSTAPILLLGPTGSGKSVLARRVYDLRKRAGRVRGPFVAVNCATLRGDSAHSTLFGHVRGAFTGAVAARKGLLKSADGGILFLDEVGELSLELQAQLLKAIEEKSYFPLGADSEVQSDFQIICATNRNPEADVRKGLFRQDLYGRINLWEFSMPSLRQRMEDIEANIDYELLRLRVEKGMFADFTPEARQVYLNFATSEEALWPDNFRSLMASMERMATSSLHGAITMDIVRVETALLRSRWGKSSALPALPAELASSPASETGPEQRPLGQRFPLQNSLAAAGKTLPAADRDLFDAVQLEEVLRVCRTSASRSEAGRRLFACSRLWRKSTDDTVRLNKYLKSEGLSWDDLALLRTRAD